MAQDVCQTVSPDRLSFWCPGCENTHIIKVSGPGAWGWNGDKIKPTFTPSVLITGGHFADGYKQGDSCWCTYNEKHADDPAPFTCQRCHSFVTNGVIQFLSDCSHPLADQSVPLTPKVRVV